MTVHHITSTSNELVKHAYKLLRDKEYRTQTRRILVEGKNLILDLIRKHTPEKIFITEKHLSLFEGSPFEIYCLADHVAEKISLLSSPEGCFAEMELPGDTIPQPFSKALILDRLQDPGNVGTLLRTALAFGVKTIFLIEPCCDPWNSKTVRSAKGAQFDLQIFSTTWEELKTFSKEFTFFVADLAGENIRQTVTPNKWMLVLGNEAGGPELPADISRRDITIPMSSGINSLNVAQAGAIALFTLSGRP